MSDKERQGDERLTDEELDDIYCACESSYGPDKADHLIKRVREATRPTPDSAVENE